MDSDNSKSSPPASTLLREPLLHFLVLAGLLFLVHSLWTKEEREKIVVDRQTAAFLIQQREDLELRQLTPEMHRRYSDPSHIA